MSLLFVWESSLWRDMFWLSLPVAEKILRAIIVYLFLVVALRIFGKRELAQLNPFDLVVLLTLSNTVQNAIIGAGQFGDWRFDRRVRADGRQLSPRSLHLQASPPRPVARGQADNAHRRMGGFGRTHWPES